MVVLKVSLNGEPICAAGKDDLSVLNAIVGALGELGPASYGTRDLKDGYRLSLNVSGLEANSETQPGNHLNWVSGRELAIGDVIEVRIREADAADPPAKRKPRNLEADEVSQRKMWESARDFYHRYRNKYEPPDA